jgi:glucose-1-phosphate thymidylyltransferase
MKGVILAGGTGTRLMPLTKITNKHLLPVYDQPMILYPLNTLKTAGISEIMIVCGREYAGHFMNFFGSGTEYGVKLSYAIQDTAGGIAHALLMAEDFVDHTNTAVILGDNIFEDDFSQTVKEFENQNGAKVFLKDVTNPTRFGVPMLKDEKIELIEEKPKHPKSDYAVTGFYLYDKEIFNIIRMLKPSYRNELELTDAHNIYIQNGLMRYKIVSGFWSDAGTFKSLSIASRWREKKENE